jgi:hypothetical protein
MYVLLPDTGAQVVCADSVSVSSDGPATTVEG